MIRTSSKFISANGKWLVVLILLISLVLRWVLIFRGGQYYNSDETRYEVSLAAARLLWRGQMGEALRQFTVSPEHLGFKFIGIIPALTEPLIGPSLVIPAIFFSFFSVLNLILIFLLAQRSQASPKEPLYALFFASACMSLLYYSRHLFPYDIAMSFGLMALYIALKPKQSLRTSLACGSLSFLCFITYNGYWPLAGFVMLASTLLNRENISHIVRQGIGTALGFITPLVIVILVILWLGTDMVSAYRLFSTSITQGVFEEGWSIPFEYLWHTEYIVFLFLGTFAILATFRPAMEQRKSTWLWLAGLLFIYFCLVIPSILKYFVVYARLARQLLPFLILLAAQGITGLETRIAYGQRVTFFLFLLILIQAAWNFNAAYRVGFPRDFAAEAQVKFPSFEFSSKRLALGAPVICQNNGYMIENSKFYVAPPEGIPQVNGQLLLSAPHPTNYLPYLYEGDSPEFRRAYRTLQLKMNFYKADPAFMAETNPEWTTMESCLAADQ